MKSLYIAPDGDDAWSGLAASRDAGGTHGPFATLERARDEIRTWKAKGILNEPVTVFLRKGRYELVQTFSLEAQDSGTGEKPIVYRSFPDETVLLSGGRCLTRFEPVTDKAILSRLSEAAAGEVVCVNLRACGVTDFGSPTAPDERPELFFDNRPMTLARWPNEGFATIAEVVGGDPFTVHGITGDRIGTFVYEGERPDRWVNEPELWLHGYWFWDWADAFQKVETLSAEHRTITLTQPYHHYGFRPGQRYYALNVLCELDTPGEWYLDRDAGLLYFWPPAPITNENAVFSALKTLVSINACKNVAFQGLTFEATRSVTVTVSDCDTVAFSNCVFRNTGSYAVSITGGSGCGVVASTLHQTGEGGLWMEGGDRERLIGAGHFVEDCHIHDFGRLYRTYRPAVLVKGVGNRIRHNRIHNGPHNAIQLNGNDHLIEYNELYEVCYETGDVGAFYMGRDWSERGTVIRFNHFHDIRGPGLHGAMSVYLDDAASGITIFGNLFVRASRAAFIGGGRDNTVENNVFVDCEPSVHIDARGLNWMRDTVAEGGVMPDRLRAMPYELPPWRDRYPQLIGLLAGARGAPAGNTVIRNLSVGGKWLNVEDAASELVVLEDNLVDADPGFLDVSGGDYRLSDDSPAWRLGFQPIPFSEIGPRCPTQ